MCLHNGNPSPRLAPICTNCYDIAGWKSGLAFPFLLLFLPPSLLTSALSCLQNLACYSFKIHPAAWPAEQAASPQRQQSKQRAGFVHIGFPLTGLVARSQPALSTMQWPWLYLGVFAQPCTNPLAWHFTGPDPTVANGILSKCSIFTLGVCPRGSVLLPVLLRKGLHSFDHYQLLLRSLLRAAFAGLPPRRSGQQMLPLLLVA